MAQFYRLTVLNTVVDIGLVPIFYHADPGIAGRIVAALATGGVRVVEFTHRGAFVHEAF